MSAENRIEQAFDVVLDRARRDDLSVELLAKTGQSTQIGFNQKKLDQFSFSESIQLGVRVIDGSHEGVAFTEDLRPESLDSLVTEARENSRMIRKERVAPLQEARELPTQPELFNPSLESVSIESKIEAASILEGEALKFDPAITAVPYTRYTDFSNQVWIGNTRGLFGTFRTNGCLAYTYCLAKDGEAAVTGMQVKAGRDFARLNPEQIAQAAAEKALARRGATRPKTGRYTIVFEEQVAESLIERIADYFNAKAVDENTSPLKGRLNQTLFSSAVSIHDDPFYLSALGGRPFDSEGFPSQKTQLVREGRLTSFLTNSVLAEKMKLPHTASAVRSPSTDLDIGISNLVVQPGQHALSDLLNAESTVIYVTQILGFAGFRPTSGDFSLPMEGDLYENGRRSGALKDFVVAGNILNLLAKIKGVGAELPEPTGNVVCPALLVPDLNVTGVSQ